tara:strand:+ start:40 stop:501 length:462 start_codon:yes stop_codon:yes gene_type:complete
VIIYKNTIILKDHTFKEYTSFSQYMNKEGFNGFAYMMVAKKKYLQPGHTVGLRIGSHARGSRGLNTYRTTRNFREWKYKSMTNMIGKFYKRKECYIFIYPTKIPSYEKVKEVMLKINHFNRYNKTCTFDNDLTTKTNHGTNYFVSNDEWKRST